MKEVKHRKEIILRLFHQNKFNYVIKIVKKNKKGI